MPICDIKGRVRPTDIKNRQHRSLLEHRHRQITDVDVVKTTIRKPHHRRRQHAAVAARRQRRATTHGVLYTKTTPVAAARAELGGRIAAGTRLSCWRVVVAVHGWSSAVKVRRMVVRRRVIGLQLQ